VRAIIAFLEALTGDNDHRDAAPRSLPE
jgi:hypothetical protein